MTDDDLEARRRAERFHQLFAPPGRAIYTDPWVRAVIDAWKVEGPSPTLHRRAQRKLLAEWPVLAEAVRALAERDQL